MSKRKSERSKRREANRARRGQQAALDLAKHKVELAMKCLAHGHDLKDVGEVYAVCQRCGSQGTKALRLSPLPRHEQRQRAEQISRRLPPLRVR